MMKAIAMTMTTPMPMRSIFLLRGENVFERLPDDLTGKILLFCDFESAMKFCRCTSKLLKQRYEQTDDLVNVWFEIYVRHRFCPLLLGDKSPSDRKAMTEYVISQTLRRRQVFKNLIQQPNNKTIPRSKQKKLKKEKHTQCVNLPHRHFKFLPILPSYYLMSDEEDENVDPPPIFYECDSFMLTTSGTGSEMILLNPFDGTLSILGNIQDYCIESSSADVEMVDSILGGNSRKKWAQESSRKPRREQYLLDSNDYFQFDIAPYFPNRDNVQLSEEYELSFMGTDAKSIFYDGKIIGNMVGIGRSVRNISHENNVVCTELTAWTKTLLQNGDPEGYGNRSLCRFPWMFHLVDMDPTNRRFFVSFHKGDGPFGHVDQSPSTSATSSRLVIYPMVEWEGLEWEHNSSTKSYFPSPLFTIECGDSISSFVLDASGETLTVATKGGNLQLWNVKGSHNLLLKVRAANALQSSIKAWVLRNSDDANVIMTLDNAARDEGDDEDILQSNVDSRFAGLIQHAAAARFQAPINCIFVSKHTPVRVGGEGFVTIHHHSDEGTSLLLWQEAKVVSLVNLPLSAGRIPRVHYEGNRLIVFGEDHIGMIILVYVIANDEFIDINGGGGQHQHKEEYAEASGGVYNLTTPRALHFANRIRHVALGGIDSFDSIHMSSNERYLIVNTRTGNLLGECPYPEGLLVIDLQDIPTDKY